MIVDGWPWGRKCSRFTLQWHLTHACTQQCRHCYDRAPRRELEWEQVGQVMEQFLRFCKSRKVDPSLTLTGGDPLLYSHFWDLYSWIVRMGIPVSILGNPLSDTQIARFERIRQPFSFQVSLEGMESANDAIRGVGHFTRTMDFLIKAQKRNWKTHVMLTLTQDNVDEVIPLAQALSGLVQHFTFNRLAPVGEGASLSLPSPERYQAFLQEYREASVRHPFLRSKENLLNLFRYREGQQLLGGCTGFGCGAAFNFVALLPDGEIHACRKFPSLLGNILSQSLSELIDSPLARQYRKGPKKCRGCPIIKKCRGCMAVIYGYGLDPLQGPDPHCFKQWIVGSG